MAILNIEPKLSEAIKLSIGEVYVKHLTIKQSSQLDEILKDFKPEKIKLVETIFKTILVDPSGETFDNIADIMEALTMDDFLAIIDKAQSEELKKKAKNTNAV